MSQENNLYEILEVSKSSTIKQIKKAYRKLAVVHHPDKGGDPEMFKKISEAYQILSDPVLRKKYDRSQPIPKDKLKNPFELFSKVFNKFMKSPLPDLLTGKQKTTPINIIKAIHEVTDLGHSKKERSITVSRAVEVSLEDVFNNKNKSFTFMITNKDLGFSVDEYKIVNPKVKVNIPVKHIAVDLEIILHVISQNDKNSFKQKVLLQIDVNAKSKKYLTRINQSDLFLRVPVSENIRSWTTKIICGKKIQFKLPENYNFTQLYMVKNIALPKSDSDSDRGTLYIQIGCGQLLNDESNSGHDRVDQIHKVELQKANWSSMFSLID